MFVTSPTGDYPLHLGEAALPALARLAHGGEFDDIFVLVDENTRRHCLPHLAFLGLKADRILEIPAGESHKNLDTCHWLWARLLEKQATRKALLLNLGGGVIGDLGGFVAATYKRGIAFVQVPTTLLSQVDASIGGKLGVDFFGVKNAIGLFGTPKAVCIEPLFLQTLPPRELRAGFAEMLKHALIADLRQWETLSALPADLSDVSWPDLLEASLFIKKEIVGIDPYEQGPRKALNFGHTIGHALESWSFANPRPLLHGEAVALGMIGEAWLSVRHAGLEPSLALQIEQTIGRFFPLEAEGFFPKGKPDWATLLPWMLQDKKNEAGKIGVALLRDIGEPLITTLDLSENPDWG